MLFLQNLRASVNNKSILNGLNLEIKPEKFMQLWVLMDQGKAL